MPKGEVKNLMMCLQAYFLKNLLFGKKMRASIKLVLILLAPFSLFQISIVAI
jgi:hypothetical protein